MGDRSVSAHVASTLRRIEEFTRRIEAVDGDDDTLRAEVLQRLGETLSELEASSEALRSQNAELHAARQRIARDRDRYHDLFERAPEPYLVTDPDGIVLAANHQARELLGRTAARLDGKPLALFVSDTRDFRRVLDWLRDGYGMRSWELTLSLDEGERSVLASVEPVPGPAGGTELRWLLSDATSTVVARKRLGGLLDSARRDVSELRVMTQWQATLLGAAAHELRTPLSAIDASLTAALSRDTTQRDDPDAADHLARAAGMVTRLRHLLPGLLDVGRLQTTDVVAERQDVDLRSVLEQVLRVLVVPAERLELDLEVDRLEADALQLERMLENLVQNAIYHTPAPETVRVRSRAHGVDVLLSVDDPGHGVPEQLREQVFSPFTRIMIENGQPEAVSSGLGLTLVSMFAAMHGGRAWVEPSDLGGASFRVLLSGALADVD